MGGYFGKVNSRNKNKTHDIKVSKAYLKKQNSRRMGYFNAVIYLTETLQYSNYNGGLCSDR